MTIVGEAPGTLQRLQVRVAGQHALLEFAAPVAEKVHALRSAKGIAGYHGFL